MVDNNSNISEFVIRQEDRRQQNIPVAVERRSGIDRRQVSRPAISTELDKDVFAAFIKQSESNPNATVLSVIPPIDKIEEISDSVKQKDYTKAGITTVLMVNSLPVDIKELSNTAKDLLNITIPEEKLIPEGYQVKASFFRGTLLEPMLKIPVIGRKLYNFDKSMYDSNFGQWLITKLGPPNKNKLPTIIPDKIQGGFIQAFKLTGKKLSCFAGYCLMRISKINLLVLALLQINPIIKEFKKQDKPGNKIKAGIKWLIKSFINILLGVTGGAILGTLFQKKGAASSLLAVGFGSYAGSKAGKYISEKIDKV